MVNLLIRRNAVKAPAIVHLNIGNIGIRAYMPDVSTIGDKSGVAVHSHAEFEYHFVMSGNAMIKFDEKSVSLNTGESILIFPDTFHKFLPCETESNVLSISFSIKENKYGANYYKTIASKLTQSGFALIKASALITEVIRAIIPAIYSDKIFALEEMRAGLTLLFVNILFHLSHERLDSNQPPFTQEYDMRAYIMEEYFNEHYMERISLFKLARRLHLSEQQTERIIKRTYGVHFREHLSKIRIKSAMELLSETEKSITEIAELVGYESYNGFYSAFKRVTGTPPAKWREEKGYSEKRTEP